MQQACLSGRVRPLTLQAVFLACLLCCTTMPGATATGKHLLQTGTIQITMQLPLDQHSSLSLDCTLLMIQ